MSDDELGLDKIKQDFNKGTDRIISFREKNIKNIKLQVFIYTVDFILVIASIFLFIKGLYLPAIIFFIAGFPEIEKWLKLFKWLNKIRIINYSLNPLI